MTQHELVVEYCKEYGSILPAKIKGTFFRGQIFGSETPKRCRELVKKGILERHRDPENGKYMRFYLTHYGQVLESKEEILNDPERLREHVLGIR